MPQIANARAVPAAAAALDRYFEVALYLLLLMGFVTLASTGGLGLTTLLIAGGAFLFRGYCLIRQRRLLIPDSWTNLLTLSYVAFYLADYLLISRTFLTATVHLVVFVTLARLFSAKRDRDYYFLAVLAFLMVLAAAVLTVDSMFLAAFAGFMLTGVAAFILMEMRYSSAKATIPAEGESEASSRRLAFSLAGTAPAIVLSILLGAGTIFFLLPRMSAGYLSAYAMRNELATGFSDRVELGQIGQIQQSRALVMHVLVEGDREGGHELKLRGVTLNVFDGRAWIDTHGRRILSPLPGGRFSLWPPERGPEIFRRTGAVPMLHYSVLMEPLGTNLFFLAATPVDLQGNYRQISIDSGGAVFNLDGERPVTRYQAWSDVTHPDAIELRQAAGAYPKGLELTYLQLPQLDARIPALAAQITNSASSNYDKAVAIESYLRTRFTYTLQLSAATPRDPLAEFLFVRKRGHCEYFASSMAVMLRTLGIPSRIVNGFRTNEFNDLTSQYMVRESDAHSWVEAYFPGYGWLSFDPTPASLSSAHSNWARFLLYVDAMQSFWRDWVVNYDVQHQAVLGENVLRSSRESIFRLRKWAVGRYAAMLQMIRRMQSSAADSPQRWTTIGLTTLLLLILASNGRQLAGAMQRRRVANRPEVFPGRAAEIWYERMTGQLQRAGWRKTATQTPGEFVASIRSTALQNEVARFTLHYEWARFGDSSADARQLPELYQRIVASTRRERA
jgi:protein-glutamine gamma-glutamyltransferase